MVAFLSPVHLWLFALLLPLWLLALKGPRTLSLWRFWSSLGLRTTSMVALVLALAGAQAIQPVTDLGVVFLLDSSDSIAPSQRARAERYIQQALGHLAPGKRAGIVVFGEQAIVERLPDDGRVHGHIAALPPGTRTNIQESIQLGLALLSAEEQQRLVLLSDGGENLGESHRAARLAAARGVPIDIISLSSVADGLDAQISGAELPTVVGEGQSLRLVVHVESHHPTAGALPTFARLVVEQHGSGGLLQERHQIVAETVELAGEPQSFAVTLPPPENTFNRYLVRLEAEGDVRPENNITEAFSFVRGKPRILLVEGTPETARPLQQALAASAFEVERALPAALPETLTALIAYDVVVLVDVPAGQVSERARVSLAAYVRELGRGLAMVGGPHSFGAGDWRDTPIEEALPVYMDVRSPTLRQPPVSIAIVIDVSGSMSEVAGDHSKIELAAEGAARIALQLRDEDEITVIPFDTAPQGIVGPLPGTQRQEAIERIGGIRAGGGGINAHDALQRAATIVRGSDKPVRHIITITDGNDTVQQEGARDLVAELAAEGVTLSSVAVGDGKDVSFIQGIVEAGKGRFFLTRDATDIPTILTSEAQVIIQPLVIEGKFLPEQRAPHPILRDIGSTPLLYGYVATTARERAQVLLAAERGDPLLAVWQYGLGRSLAWTPDMRGQWARDWMGWPGYQQFAAQMMVWLLPTPESHRLALDARTLNGQLVLSASAHTEAGAPATGLRVEGQMLAADGESIAVNLHEVAPGSYRLAVRNAPPGVYLVHLLSHDSEGNPQASVTGGAVVPFSAEYRRGKASTALLHTLAETTGGRANPPPRAVYDDTGQHVGRVHEIALPLVWLALLLLPFDVAVRRLMGRRRWSPRLHVRQRGRRKGDGGRDQTGKVAKAGPPAPPPVVVPPQPLDDDPLERLRAAQERARKRARGEE